MRVVKGYNPCAVLESISALNYLSKNINSAQFFSLVLEWAKKNEGPKSTITVTTLPSSNSRGDTVVFLPDQESRSRTNTSNSLPPF
jgi:hypothetical protein